MVIQESFMHRRLVIASNLGGMAENLTDGVDIRHVPVANLLAWAGLTGDEDEWRRLYVGIKLPPVVDDAVEGHTGMLVNYLAYYHDTR